MLTIFGARQTIAQQPEDWSELFPEIPNCERKINSIEQNIDAISQSAVYTRNGLLCVSIAFTLKFPAKKSETGIVELDKFPFAQKFKILNYDAYRSMPRCGVDRSPGSIFVRIDKGKLVGITSYEYDYLITGEPAKGRNSLLKIAKGIDYKLLQKSMEKWKF